jgi:hypothetical protein
MAQKWLLSHQDTSGGWAERPGGTVNVLNTAEVMLSLFTSGIDAGDSSIRRGVSYLLEHRHDFSDPDRGAWARDFQDASIGRIRHIPDILRSSAAVTALIRAGEQEESKVQEGLAWLLARQNSNKGATGWGYQRSSKNDIIPSSFALLALIEASGTGMTDELKRAIEMGLKYLVGQQNKASGLVGAADAMAGARTTYAVLALQAASRRNLSVHAAEEKLAIHWVLANPVQSRATAEETAAIDPQGTGNYDFLFMPKLLTVQFQDLEHKAVQELLLDFSDDFDDASGGFYGRRIFSWSTALALQALSASHLEALPVPAAVYTGSTVGIAVLAFGVILVGAVLLLAMKQLYSALVAMTFVIVLLAVLLAYGTISNKTFQELFLVVAAPLKRSPKD